MQNITSLQSLYKRDSKGKIRIWTVEVGYDSDDVAGIRSISGTVDGEKITSVWNMIEAKNVGRANATNAREQAEAEAQSQWTKKADKEYFTNVADIDSYEIFKPMLAHDFTKTPVEDGYTQPKLDGIRCIVDRHGMHTRSGKPINSCPHIWEEVRDLLESNPNVTLDGELYNHELKQDFNKIVSLVRKTKFTDADLAESQRLVQYHVYDIHCSSNPDVTFSIRNVELEEYVTDSFEQYVHLVPTTFYNDQDELDELYSAYTADGYEGQMVRLDEKYENKRSKYLLKRKEFITEEFEVISMEEGQGNWSGHTKRFILRLADGREVGAGVRGNQDQLSKLWESQETPSWATLRYFDLTPDGIPRFPVVIDYGVGERDD